MDDDMRSIQITLQSVVTEQGRMAEQIKCALKRIDERGTGAEVIKHGR